MAIVPTITPYPKDPRQANPNVPRGQTGYSYSQGFIGPIPYQSGQVGAPITSTKILSAPITNTPQQSYSQTSGGGGSVSQDGKYWSSREDYEKDVARAASLGMPVGELQNYNREQDQKREEERLTGQINEVYNPAMENLSLVEQQYRQQYPQLEQELTQSFEAMKPEMQKAQQTQLSGVAEQRATGEREKTSQIGQARDLYNELRQGGLTRYGGSSSTGEAYSDILGRATSRQYGDINKQFADLNQKLTKEEGNVNNFFTQKSADLEKEKQLGLQKLKNTFDDKIREVNMQRNVLESEKASRRLGILQELSAQYRQIQADTAAFQRDLEAWKQYKDEAIRTARDFQAKSFNIPSFSNKFGAVSMSGIPSGGGATPTNQIYGGQVYGGQITDQKEDENQLIDLSTYQLGG